MSFITLIRPPFVYSRRAYSKPVVPPLNVAYLASVLREAGHRVEIIDALAEGLSHTAETSAYPQIIYQGLPSDSIVERICPDTDAVGVSCMFSLEWPHTEEILFKIHKRFPSVPLIIGGEHATATCDYILKTCPAVSLVALGEGEETLSDYADFLDGKKALAEISGLAYRKNGDVVKTAPRARIKNVDALPLPAWDLIPMHIYHEAGMGYGVDRGVSMPILATRGCPYQCTFCSNLFMWSTRYFLRDPEKVLDEIELYLKTVHATNIDFYDLTAIVKRQWVLDFCKGILKRKLRLTWQLPVGTRSEALDKEVLTVLYASGCRNICYAPESGSENVLQEIKKKVNLNRLNTSLKDGIKQGLNVKVSLIIGFPKETRAELWKTLRLIVTYARLGVHDVGLFCFSPYPGSELYASLREEKKVPELSNDYFASLAAFMDFTVPVSYCENVGPRELNVYRISGLFLFYFLSFLFRPARFLKAAKNVFLNKSETVFEQRILDGLKRRAERYGKGLRGAVNTNVPAIRDTGSL